jgi:6-pyruvoyltetrahydropterin/6-carboxytetrahydropterin synthase
MYQSTKIIELGSCAFRQPKAKSHCRHLHGYRLLSKIWFNSHTLDENNWVMDFGALKDLKTTLERIFDHTLVVDAKDPLLDLFKQLATADAAQIVIMDDGVGIEKFAKKVYDIANNFVITKTKGRVWVSKVEVWEHEKNSAIYSSAIADVSAEMEPGTTFEVPLQAEEIKLEVPGPAPAPEFNPHAARVGNHVSKGWSNPFAGTSWGA